MSRRYQSSRPAHWVEPRPYSDAGLRQHHYGKLQPMERPVRFHHEVLTVALWLGLFAIGALFVAAVAA